MKASRAEVSVCTGAGAGVESEGEEGEEAGKSCEVSGVRDVGCRCCTARGRW